MQEVFISVNRLWFPFNAKYVFINQMTYPSLWHDSLLLPPLLLHMHDLCEAHNLISSNEHRYSLVSNNKESNTFNKKKREKKQNKLKKNALFVMRVQIYLRFSDSTFFVRMNRNSIKRIRTMIKWLNFGKNSVILLIASSLVICFAHCRLVLCSSASLLSHLILTPFCNIKRTPNTY